LRASASTTTSGASPACKGALGHAMARDEAAAGINTAKLPSTSEKQTSATCGAGRATIRSISSD
jgi:hypothetical protein